MSDRGRINPAHGFDLYGHPHSLTCTASGPPPAIPHTPAIPTGLKRYQANREAHFEPFRCHRREARLAEPGAYETFARVVEQTRRRHSLLVYGYVLMPEHVPLLTAEPPMTLPATVWKAAKQESAKKRKGEHRHVWQAR